MQINTASGPVVGARVDHRLLHKADRLFTGTIAGRMIELLQNARRAGARHVTITVADGWIGVQDDGQGIGDFQQLLNLGGSGWSEDIQAGEDPAGVGLFSLAPRETIIASRGRMIYLQAEHWTGAPVPIETMPEPTTGTLIRFRADAEECQAWACGERLLPYAVFTGLTVTTADGQMAPQPFLPTGDRFEHPELGLAITIVANLADLPAHRQVHAELRRGYGYCDNVLLNFHGQVMLDRFDGVDIGCGPGLTYLVDMTGAATDLRLMLPARTQIVQNEVYEQFKRLLTLDTFRHFQRRGRQTLPFQEWQRARAEFGLELPESEPVFKIGLLHNDGTTPEPPEIPVPDGFTVTLGYRLGDDLPDGTYRAWISEYDGQHRFDTAMQNRVKQEYAFAAVARQQRALGRTVERRMLAGGDLEVTIGGYR